MALETYQSTLSGAQMDAAIIEMNERNSEAYAVGKRGGVDVGTTDPTYHNNSKYYSEVAQQAAGSTPYIGANGNWYEWDSSTQQFVDTGVKAEGQDGEDGTGIQSITKTGTSGNIDTYTITLEDGRTSTFTVTNGTSIASITKTSTEGKVDTYTVTLTDGSTTTFAVTNGNDGENASVTVTEYQASNDGTTIPTGTWTTTIPAVQGGQYLWTRFTWNVGTYSYIVARQGVNGTGTGDMEKSVYDADNTVANAGGIVNYVDENGGKIDHIKVNGTEQAIANKTVDLSVVELDSNSSIAFLLGYDAGGLYYITD